MILLFVVVSSYTIKICDRNVCAPHEIFCMWETEDEKERKNFDKFVTKKKNKGARGIEKTGKQHKKPAALKTPEDSDISVDASVDPFGQDVFSAANVKSSGVRERGGTFLNISKPIKVIGEDKLVYVCVMGLTLANFFMKSGYLQLPLLKLQSGRQLFKNHVDYLMSWVQTIQNSDRRIAYSTQDALMKTSKNNTQSVIYWVVTAATDSDIEEIINSITKDFRTCFRVYSKPGSIGRGASFLEFLQGMGNSGLHGFFIRKYSDGVHEEPAADALTAIFDATFNDPGLKLCWNISLDKFLPNYVIKHILVNHAHVTGWDDLPDQDKEACFHNSSTDMSRLPKWNSMVKIIEYGSI